MQNETINPIIHAIPEGETVTVITARGERFTGTDDTSGEEASAGLFVLYSYNPNHRLERVKANKKTYLIAADIVGFQLEYDR